MPDPNNRPVFEIGLTMAGAISAGAYTAGAIDFLFEALDAIEDVRAGRDTKYLSANLEDEKPIFDPPHTVQIRTMSGTSAGSMVTAIVATLLRTRVKPVTSQRSVTDNSPSGNPLYDSWVQNVHYDKLLSTTDLAGGRNILSLLNSEPLGDIVKAALKFSEQKNFERPYIADPLTTYFCLSNLRGVGYTLQLNVAAGVINEYQMSLHADWMGFAWTVGGNVRPGMITISPGVAAEWDVLGNSALASGAFPVGLAARGLKRRFDDYPNRQWFIPGALLAPERRKDAAGKDVDPADRPESWRSRAGELRPIPTLNRAQDFPDGFYDFVNVDGGIFNNEPLELARRDLAGAEQRNPRDPEAAKRSVILIDPFPNVFELEKDFNADKHLELLAVIKTLFSALIAQARFKLDELALAKDPNVASRHAIMPVRYNEQTDKPERYSIACGALGGFGGFLSKDFRHHDYMLGRRNCQRFLSHHFTLPAAPDGKIANPLFDEWTDPKTRAAFEVLRQITVDDVPQQVVHLPIIPLLGKLGSPAYTKMPAWPRKPRDLVASKLKAAILERANAVKDSLVAQYKPAFWLRQGINAYWAINRSAWIDRFAMSRVVADLKRRGITMAGSD